MSGNAVQELPAGAIAIVGMACRLPGANSLTEFWRNVVGNVESIRFFSEQELVAAGLDGAVARGSGYVGAAGILDDIAGFDAAYFGISAREAATLDPQHRIFLETCVQALEDASLDPDRCAERIGVYAGCNLSGYAGRRAEPREGITAEYMEALVGNDKDYLSTRVSYRLNLRGPSVTVGTACSTSLAAVAMACQSLQLQACDAVLAGGVSINVPQRRGYRYGDGSDALSVDGHCRAFDARATGTPPANGAGVVVLKRLEDALENRDAIYAVIRGAAMNNDGNDKVGYWAPSVAGHAELVSEALAFCGINARDIGFVEAHGTGTPMGDPIEVAALTEAFRQDTDERGYCALGSVKTQIGHATQAAGVAGLLRAALAVQQGVLPPNLHFERANPNLRLEQSPFVVHPQSRPWPARGPRRAGVSSLGLGGTNVHLVLEQAPSAASDSARNAPPHLLPLSAQSEDALDDHARGLLQQLEQAPTADLAGVSAALCRGRRQLAVRGCFVAQSTQDAIEQLQVRSKRNWRQRMPSHPPEVVFVFPGAAQLDLPAVRRLSQRFAELQRTVAQGASIAASYGVDLQALVTAPADPQDGAGMLSPVGAMTGLLVVEVALARQLQSFGLAPCAVLGHSAGEYAAACVAGALRFDDAVALQAQRALLLDRVPNEGRMLTVNLPAQQLRDRLGQDIPIAAFNADDVTLLAGTPEQVRAWSAQLQSDEVVCRVSDVPGASHSRFVEPIVAELSALAATVPHSPPRCMWLSSVTGEAMPKAAPDGDYWVRQVRQPVRFVQALKQAAATDSRVLVEVGPSGQLGSLMLRSLRGDGRALPVLSSLPGPRRDALAYFMGQVGRLWTLGSPVDLVALGGTEDTVPARLPGYPFERVRHWLEPQATAAGAPAAPNGPYLYRPVWTRTPAAPAPAPDLVQVLLSDGCPLCEALAERARHTGQPLHRIDCYADSRRPRGEAFDPSDPRALSARLEGIAARAGGDLQLVRCLAGRALDSGGPQDEHGNTTDLLAEPAGLALAASRLPALESLEWVLISAATQPVLGDERVDPVLARLAAAVRVLPREVAKVSARWLDVSQPTCGGALSSTAERVAAELALPTAFEHVALRQGQRWVQSYQPLEGPSRDALANVSRFVITGGLGRMGLSLARYLGERPGVRLLLTHRRRLPPTASWPDLADREAPVGSLGQVLWDLQDLRARGIEVETAEVDACDEPAMASLFGELQRRWGGIDGIFHFAASLGDKATATLTDPQLETALAQNDLKRAGAQALATLVPRHGIRFCCLASSLTAQLGGLGNYPYAAANRGLAALAEHLDGTAGARWVAIDFDYYRPQAVQEGRNDPREVGSSALRRLATEGALQGRQLLEVVEAALSSYGAPLVLASALPLARHVDRHTSEARGQEPMGGRPQLQSRYEAPTGPLACDLVQLWEDLLRVSPIGVADNFFELGGDSLLLARLVAACRDRLQLNLSVKQLLENPTVGELTRAVEAGSDGTSLFALRAPAQAHHALVCVPYAGGSELTYRELADALPPTYALLVLPAMRTWDTGEGHFDRAVQALGALATPFSVYGHCGGSFAAIELVRRLEVAGLAPQRVFAAATYPPLDGESLSESARRGLGAPGDAAGESEAVQAFMRQLGGLPAAATETDAAQAALAIRQDGEQLSATYERFRQAMAQRRLATPLVCLFGTADPMTERWQQGLTAWQRHFERVSHRMLEGSGHYFVHGEADRVADLIDQELGPRPAATQQPQRSTEA